MNKVLSLFFLVIASGCSLKNVSQDYSFDKNSTQSLIVGSITFDGYYASYNVILKNIDTQKVYRLKSGGSMTPFHLFNPKTNMHHLGIEGDLFTNEIPPGKYEIYDWKVSPGNGVVLYPDSNFKISFEVVPGQALYLGNFHFHQTATYGVTISGAEVMYKNAYERDVEEFKNRFENINLANIKSNISFDSEIYLGHKSVDSTTILLNSIQFGILQAK